MDSVSSAVANTSRNGESTRQEIDSSLHNNVLSSSSSGSHVIIYRSAKYRGAIERMRDYASTYSRVYILQPIMSSVDKFRKSLYEILGFFLLMLATPFLLVSSMVLYIIRRIRIQLVKSFYPNATICEDFQPRCILLGKSLGMVTAVVWTRGKVDIDNLRQRFEFSSLSCAPSLRKRLTDKYGVRIWTDSLIPFDVKKHIVAAPSKFYSLPITDVEASHSHYGNKSVLQKYVTSCASEKVDLESSPWQIYVIPQTNGNKERTCCVLRFHTILLSDVIVRDTLDQLFSQKLVMQVDGLIRRESPGRTILNNFTRNCETCSEVVDEAITQKYENRRLQSYGSVISGCSKGNILDQPLGCIVNFRRSVNRRISHWIKTNLMMTYSDFRSWLSLRTKQYRFHNKSDLIKVLGLELCNKFSTSVELLKRIPENRLWNDLREAAYAAFLIFRAYCDIPIEIIACLISSKTHNGFCRSAKMKTRQISWSAPISQQLVEAIQEKTDCSFESIVLTACALALKNYYLETSLPNPNKIGVAAPSLSCDLLSCTGFRAFDLPTNNFNIPYQLMKINRQLTEYPEGKLLGTYYTLKHISYFLPRSLAYVVLRKLMKRYPLTFNFVNIKRPFPVPLPHISIWGQTVDEFTFWRAPQSDFCVCVTLVKYAETMRLTVLSPMKSIDTALTQKFSFYMNSIAEAVGVERSRIPYSRKSSPATSACTSPTSAFLRFDTDRL